MTTLLVLGERVRTLETIPRMGLLLGYRSRTTAYKAAKSQDWPIVGEPGSQRVSVPALAQRLGIPYEVVPEKED